MLNTTIKEILLQIFSAEFDVKTHVDLYNTKRQEFEYSAYFEYKTDKWHDAELKVEGLIIKDAGPDLCYNPLRDGRIGENQGAGVFISDWSINKIIVLKDGLPSKIEINLNELSI